jgi:hypothetical protein
MKNKLLKLVICFIFFPVLIEAQEKISASTQTDDKSLQSLGIVNDQCTICLEDLTDLNQTSKMQAFLDEEEEGKECQCRYGYHNDCLKELFKHTPVRCPSCRAEGKKTKEQRPNEQRQQVQVFLDPLQQVIEQEWQEWQLERARREQVWQERRQREEDYYHEVRQQERWLQLPQQEQQRQELQWQEWRDEEHRREMEIRGQRENTMRERRERGLQFVRLQQHEQIPMRRQRQ